MSDTEAKKAELLLLTQNRAISRCMLKYSGTGQVVAASTGLLWPVGLFLAGLWGVFGMAGLAIGIIVLMLKSGNDEAKAVEQALWEGDCSKASEYLTDDDLLEINRFAIAAGLVKEEPKKTSPVMGQKTTPTTTSSTGTQRNSDGSEKSVSLNNLDELLSTAVASSVLLASLRGTGKTSLLQELLDRPDSGEIIGLDPKNSNSLGVLEPYFKYVPPDQENTYLATILGVRKELNHRNQKRLETKDCEPLWLIIDEYQTTRQCWSKETQEKVRNALSFIVNQGRERRVFVILMGQSPLCSDIGFSGGERANMAILAMGCDEQQLSQGGGGGWDSVDRMLASSHLIPDKKSRETLKVQLALAKERAGQQGRVLVTPSGVSLVPDLSKKKYEALTHRVWGQQQSDEDLIVEQAEQPQQKKQRLEDRILGWLSIQSEPRAAWEIRNYCTDKSDPDRPDVNAVRNTLAGMVEQCLLRFVSDGVSQKYELESREK